MISNNQIKYIRSLHQKKFRQKYNKFIVEGDKICRDLLDQNKYEIDIVYATKSWLLAQGEKIRNLDIIAEQISEKDLQKISGLKTANQVLCIVSVPPYNITLTKEHKLVVFLENISDPGNMGTIMRIADWFGFDAVVAGPGSVEFYNPKVIQSSMGSFCNIDLLELDFDGVRENYPDKFIVAGALSGESIYSVEFPDELILLIGNESAGASKSILNQVDKKIKIPSYGSQTDSLNAAMATAVICSEVRRQIEP